MDVEDAQYVAGKSGPMSDKIYILIHHHDFIKGL